MAELLDQTVGQVQPQHVEGSVGEIDDPCDAEDERKAGRDEKQGTGARQPVQELDENRGSGHQNKIAGTCPAIVIRRLAGITARAVPWLRPAAAGTRYRRRNAS